MDVDPKKLLKQLPKLRELGGEVTDDGGEIPKAEQVLEIHRDRIPRYVLERLFSREPQGDRSKAMWRLYFALFQSGLAPLEVQSLVQCSSWNKFGGDINRLRRDILKAWGLHAVDTGDGRSTNGRATRREIWSESVDKILAREVKDPGWMIQGLWSEQAHGIVAGEPKVRKSWLAIDIALSVATGTKVFGYFDVPKALPVLYIQEELSASELHKRMRWVARSKELGGEIDVTPRGISVKFPSSIPMYVRSRKQFDLTSVPDLEALQHEIVSREVKLVILDPLQMMLGSGDENSASSMRPILLNLQALKELTGCSIMLIHHYAKPSANNPKVGGQRMLGSQAFHAWVECGLYLSKPEPYITHVEREFRNFEPFPDFEIEYVGGSEGYAVTVTEESKTKAPEPMSDFEFYVSRHEGLSVTALAELFEKTRKTIMSWAEKSLMLDLKEGQASRVGGRKPWIVVLKKRD